MSLTPHFVLFAAVLLPSLVRAQESTLVRIASEHPAELAARLERAGYDVPEGRVGERFVEVVVAPDELRELRAAGLELDVLAVGRPFAKIQAEQAVPGPEGAVPSGYLDWAQIVASMSSTAAAHASICALHDVTASYAAPATWNGRSIHALKISDNVAVDEDEPEVLIVADYHAREIVTPVIALHAAAQLTSLYGSNPQITALVDAHEIWIVPVCNPDGYEHVFTADNLWRKNRRDNGSGIYGVDLNRNHAFGWSASCGGSTSTSSSTYRGPAPESEPEVQTILAFTAARRFAKVLDYHSSGREVLYGYSCSPHPWNTTFFDDQAQQLSNASGYGTIRPPTAEGEHYEWQLWRGAFAFLIETHDQFQPSYASAQAEAAQLWPGIVWMLARPVSLSGHVTDACSGAPLAAAIEPVGVGFANGESFSSGGVHGRYDVVAAPGSYSVRFSAPGHASTTVPINVTATSTQVLDVALVPSSHWTSYCTSGTTSAGCVPALTASGTPSASASSGFVLTASAVDGQRSGLIFYGTSGALAAPWAIGSTSTLCVKAPRQRTGVQDSGGTAGACNGVLALDWNAYASSNPGAVGTPFSAGDHVWAQAWFRDPPAVNATSLTGGVEFWVCP